MEIIVKDEEGQEYKFDQEQVQTLIQMLLDWYLSGRHSYEGNLFFSTCEADLTETLDDFTGLGADETDDDGLEDISPWERARQ
jgi:hypothetical protein